MNIAIIIPELGGGGAERVAQIVGNYYVEKGENVYYFLMETGIKQVYSVKGRIVQTGIKSCMENAIYGNAQVLLRLLQSASIMRRWKKKYQINVAISFMEEANYLNVLSRKGEKVITRVCTILSQREELKGILYNKYLVQFFYNLSDKVIVMSDYARKDMSWYYGVSYRKLVKIPNPSISVAHQNIEKHWKYGNQVVICVGRLEHVKQQERIIRAFSYVLKHQTEARLLILGMGPNKKYLEYLCRQYGIAHAVFFVGFIDDVGFYLKNSRVFVMASEVEGFPNSMVEAMAYGVPVVTTDSPGACGEIVGKKEGKGSALEIQHCTYGILTPSIHGKVKIHTELVREELLLGKAIEEILVDRALYEKYHRQSQKRSRIYSMEKVIRKWDRLVYDENR